MFQVSLSRHSYTLCMMLAKMVLFLQMAGFPRVFILWCLRWVWWHAIARFHFTLRPLAVFCRDDWLAKSCDTYVWLSCDPLTEPCIFVLPLLFCCPTLAFDSLTLSSTSKVDHMPCLLPSEGWYSVALCLKIHASAMKMLFSQRQGQRAWLHHPVQCAW